MMEDTHGPLRIMAKTSIQKKKNSSSDSESDSSWSNFIKGAKQIYFWSVV